MGSVVLTIPQDIKSQLRDFPWVIWSEVAREEIENQETELKSTEELSQFSRLASKSKLTEEEAVKLGMEFNKLMRKKRSE